MWRETDSAEGGRASRRLHIINARPGHEGGRSEREQRFERRFASADHADGARHAASPSVEPPVHNWQPNGQANGQLGWQQTGVMPPAYEPPPEPSALWESLKMALILGVTIGGALYGVYALNTFLDSQHKEIPVYGDTAAPPPGRGTGPPNITWGGGAKH